MGLIPYPCSGRTEVMGPWKETPEGYVLKVDLQDLPGLKKEEVKAVVKEGILQIDLPGLKNEEVKVVVKQRILQISVDSKKEPKVKKFHWNPLSKKAKAVKVLLPKNAKAVKVKDSMENGVLTVTVPKVEKKKR